MTRRIRDAAADAGREFASGAAELAIDEARSRRENPEYWAEFHEDRLVVLPRWCWVARLWHRNRASRFRSHARAQEKRQ